MFMDDVADLLHDGKLIPNPSTSDFVVDDTVSPPWAWAIEFTRHKRTFVVLLPSTTDFSEKDGTFATRHCALYALGERVDLKELTHVAQEFAAAFVRAYKYLYGRAISQSKASNQDS
jgi:hypothetical protein